MCICILHYGTLVNIPITVRQRKINIDIAIFFKEAKLIFYLKRIENLESTHILSLVNGNMCLFASFRLFPQKASFRYLDQPNFCMVLVQNSLRC